MALLLLRAFAPVQVALEVEARHRRRAAQMDAAVRLAGSDRQVQAHRRAAAPADDVPVAIDTLIAGQLDRLRRDRRHLVERAEQIGGERGEVRAELVEQIALRAEDPVVERAELDQAERIQPVDAQVIERAERAARGIAPHRLVARHEEKIVVDAQAQAARRGELGQRLALAGAQPHRLFDEHALARLEQAARHVLVQERRQQHVHDVAVGSDQLVDGREDTTDAEGRRDLARALLRYVAHRRHLDRRRAAASARACAWTM